MILVDHGLDQNESIVDGEPVGATSDSHVQVGFVVIVDLLMDKIWEYCASTYVKIRLVLMTHLFVDERLIVLRYLILLGLFGFIICTLESYHAYFSNNEITISIVSQINNNNMN